MINYESILRTVHNLAPSVSAAERDVQWLTPAAVVGLSRTHGGRIEIFLAGPELTPKSRLIRRFVEYQMWHRKVGQSTVDATRLLLPAAGHFDQVAAFLCAELLRAGADENLESALANTEPLIELAIAKLRITDRAVLGLTGELLLLSAILRHARGVQLFHAVQSWQGWRESTRDFSWNSLGVEVKTTTRSTSSHQIQGMHQIEAVDHFESGVLEQRLFLVSIGMDRLTEATDNSYTLPQIVESILVLLRQENGASMSEFAVETFLDHVAQYGGDADLGYDHRSMSRSFAFNQPFVPRFVRCYDMSDPAIEVLRSADVSPYQHVDAASVEYRIVLPPNVRGDLNPVTGLNAVADEILLASS